MSLTVEQILAGNKAMVVEVDMRPYLDGSLWIRPISAGDFAKLQDQTEGMGDMEKVATMMTKSICNENGTLLFRQKQAKDLLAMPHQIWVRLSETFNAINGFDKNDEEVAENLNEAPGD